ncbi:MAG: hypothetical protein HC896_10630 [Bacteroidales bacterium]|nr:hypothetical protein [Bacteroidales bacterium]
MPGAVYNGNRFISRNIPYSPKLKDIEDIGIDKPMIISDVPRLNTGMGRSAIQERSGGAALPCIGVYSPVKQWGFLIFTMQGDQHGDFGLSITENHDRSQAEICISAPVVREITQYTLCNNSAPSTDKPADYGPGEEVNILFKTIEFNGDTLNCLFVKYNMHKNDLMPKPKVRQLLPLSVCFTAIEEKFNRDNWNPGAGYYSVGMKDGKYPFLQDWQIGWTGGMISTLPLLAQGNVQSQDNVRRNFEWVFAKGISTSGFFYDSGEQGKFWYGGDIRNELTKTGTWCAKAAMHCITS